MGASFFILNSDVAFKLPQCSLNLFHRETMKNWGKDVWNFPQSREIPYIKKETFRSAEG